ncbi:hypothetical protein RVR_8124 [Actinacidiphila reveromycinica]|uniref:non-specific serine/threonine protein kinase n=1 Tax=Actinacidiphila reveromycinica TaxID=659352 RepID=A0A7U3UVA3_9ACTN|nr:hypothetical protein [Streptomyces sp. SN-593]BBB00921.1 hypothetical protein RVR_8124 [Streptomyces sp. SN-593]
MGPAHSGPDFGQDLGPDVRGPVFAPLLDDDPAAVSGHRISARLGADGPGAAGVTYLAYDPGGQPVALTVIRPGLTAADGFAARFHHDAQAAARVPGPRAVPVVGSGREGDRYWIASGYVPSLSLRAAVEVAGPLPTGVVLRLVAALAEGLQAMHHAGVVHGGLRPAHVLLAGDGPRVKGHGLAWVAEAAGPGTAAGEAAAGGASAAGGAEDAGGDAAAGTGTGAGADGAPGAGTVGAADAGGAAADAGEESGAAPGAASGGEPGTDAVGEATAFRSPEQAAGKPARPATDVFALGQIAAYASIGAAPFGDGSRVQHAEPDLNELPGQLREIVTRCLIKDPALRPSLAQITTMCAQAAPESRPVSWLPAPLLAAILPAIPPPHFAPPRAAPPSPAAPAAPPRPPEPARPPAPDAGPDARPEGAAPAPAGPPPQDAPAPAAAAPAQLHAPAPPAPAAPAPPSAAPHGGYLWHPQQWPRAPYVHVPLPLPRRRRKAVGVVAAVAGVAVVATAAVALSSSSGNRSAVGARPPEAGAPQQSPSGSAPSRQTPAPGQSAPTAPSPTSPPPGGDATGSPPGAALVYQQMELPAGDGLSLRTDPPAVGSGTNSGDFGLTGDASAFTVDRTRDTLAVVGPDSPMTVDTCRSAVAAGVDAVDAASLGEGSRLCVRSVDGTLTALVTFRQLPLRQVPHAAAVFDVTVWHEVGERSAPGTGISANFDNGVARRWSVRVN